MNRFEITASGFKSAITKRIHGRFVIGEETTTLLLNLAPDILIDRDVIQIRRENYVQAKWRTFLIVVIKNHLAINSAFRWAATIKDQLLNPSSADLYLIVAIKENDLNEDQLLGFESSDLFCRKFFLRTNETVEQLLDRSFLSYPDEAMQLDELTDPLSNALAETAKAHPWFSNELMLAWKNEFLSGKSGNELIDAIFTSTAKNDTTL